MLYRYLIISILLISCNEEAYLAPSCSQPCYTGPEETRNVGSCTDGVPVCEEGTNEIIACDGEILPQADICDGLDNNCDGTVDNDAVDSPDCLNLGECSGTSAVCTNGAWICPYEDTVEEDNETRCDGLDNDCDGLIDENIFDVLPIAERSCYRGNPPDSIEHLPCHPGILECINANVVCINDRTPEEEICNGIDDNCDGIIDDNLEDFNKEIDVVIIIDNSGSMDTFILSVATAITSYIDQFTNDPRVRFALVTMSHYEETDEYDPYNPNSYDLVKTIEDFNDIVIIIDKILSLMNVIGAGKEASFDSLKYVCDTHENIQNLSWREDSSKLVFSFTDEQPQTYAEPPTTSQMIIGTCIGYEVVPYQWSKHEIHFKPTIRAAGGDHFELINDFNQIINDLNSISLFNCK